MTACRKWSAGIRFMRVTTPFSTPPTASRRDQVCDQRPAIYEKGGDGERERALLKYSNATHATVVRVTSGCQSRGIHPCPLRTPGALRVTLHIVLSVMRHRCVEKRL